MKKMEVKEFKVKCIKVLDRVNTTREPVLITKKSRPPVKLVPTDPVAKDFLGCLAGTIEIVGDIKSPVEPPEAWKALH